MFNIMSPFNYPSRGTERQMEYRRLRRRCSLTLGGAFPSSRLGTADLGGVVGLYPRILKPTEIWIVSISADELFSGTETFFL